MGLEEPVKGIGNNFVGVSGRDETCPPLGGITSLSIVGFKYKDTSPVKPASNRVTPEGSM